MNTPMKMSLSGDRAGELVRRTYVYSQYEIIQDNESLKNQWKSMNLLQLYLPPYNLCVAVSHFSFV